MPGVAGRVTGRCHGSMRLNPACKALDKHFQGKHDPCLEASGIAGKEETEMAIDLGKTPQDPIVVRRGHGDADGRQAGTKLHLTILATPGQPLPYPVASAPLDGDIVIGRGCQLRGFPIQDTLISGRHFRVAQIGDGWVLEDQGSTNGTWLNGERVGAARIIAQDVIKAGHTLFLVTEEAPRGPLDTPADGPVAGCSHALHCALARLRAAGAAGRNILLSGETGTGKGEFARLVHAMTRKNGPFEHMDCPAIPPNLFASEFCGVVKGAFTGATNNRTGHAERAHGGTLFLDEIGDLPQDFQGKLLVFLDNRKVRRVGGSEERTVDVRIVAATNRVDDTARALGVLRPDLYARLAQEAIFLPPLRQRREDIPALVWRTITRSGRTPWSKLEPEFVERLLLHPWGGNARELHNVFATRSAHAEIMEELVRLKAIWTPATESDDKDDDRQPAAAPEQGTLLRIYQKLGHSVRAVAKHFRKHPRQVYRWNDYHDLERREGVWRVRGAPAASPAMAVSDVEKTAEVKGPADEPEKPPRRAARAAKGGGDLAIFANFAIAAVIA